MWHKERNNGREEIKINNISKKSETEDLIRLNNIK